MIICGTGHRPNKLWGYDIHTEPYRVLGREIRRQLIAKDTTEVISGMALGFDTVLALVTLKLREDGYPIKLRCAVPCTNMGDKWPPDTVKEYENILKRSDVIVYVQNKPYTEDCMQKRNIYMVDQSDLILAFWDGSRGGTKNCIQYAKEVEKPILNIWDNIMVKK